MVWNNVHDKMLFREILVVDPFTETKKGTVERGTNFSMSTLKLTSGQSEIITISFQRNLETN